MISYLSSIVTMSLFCTVSEILSLISQKYKMTHDRDNAHSILVLKHHMVNQCVKFQVSSFSNSVDILGENKNVNGSHDHNHTRFRDDLSSVCWD